MNDWLPHLTPDEQARLTEIKAEKRKLSAEARRIQDRGRKRADRK
jgi:hypothetical protein